MKRFWFLGVLFFSLLGTACLADSADLIPQSQPQTKGSTVGNSFLEKDVPVAVRDGVILRADVLRPRKQGRFPTLVYRTPYNKEEALKGYSIFRKAVERGYAVVLQDVRGRYASSGEFVAYQNEGRDGYDTIEWAARQLWCDGNIGTFGLSYPGAVQWLAAVESPPHLKAMVPAMTFSTPRNFFYSSGVFDMSWIEWIWNNIAPDTRAKKNLPGPRTYDQATTEWKAKNEEFLLKMPLDSLEELRGIAPYYYEWLHHPPDDGWWDWAELHGKYPRVHAAVLNLSGWYDEDYGPEGATTNFLGLLASRSKEREKRTHLLIGPWIHGVEETGLTKSGERSFGPSARINYDEVVLRWMDRYVRNVRNGVDREKPVRLFVMGDDRWREDETWPLRGAQPTSFYLAGAGARGNSSERATDERQSAGPHYRGRLTGEAPAKEQLSGFAADPRHPVMDPYAGSLGAHDFRDLAKRPDVLVFDTEALNKDVEGTGPITAEIYASCDCPDFDLWVRLLDVAPDGTAFNLMSPGSDVLRASYRDSAHARQLLTPDEIYKLTLTNMRTGNVFKAGHRIRVQISASFSPDFSRNLQSGELETTSSNGRTAKIRIYHDRQHPSRVILPVLPR